MKTVKICKIANDAQFDASLRLGLMSQEVYYNL